jgi:hypothetical protein
MSNINISKTIKNDSKSNIVELTNSELVRIQGGKGQVLPYSYRVWLETIGKG